MPVGEIDCKSISLFSIDTGEKIGDINANAVSLNAECEYETDYVRDKDHNKLFSVSRQKSKTLTLSIDTDKGKLDQIFGIDESHVSDSFSMQKVIKIQNRVHKKKRINKKWAKRYGYHYKYIDLDN